MDVQLTNLQQLHDAVMSIWTKIKAVLNSKEGPTWDYQGVLNKVADECIYLAIIMFISILKYW